MMRGNKRSKTSWGHPCVPRIMDQFIMKVPPAGGIESGNLLLVESFDDNSFSGRGWYDSPAGTIASDGVNKNDGSGAVLLNWTTSATDPVGGSPRRHAFTETDSVYISYDVKHSTNWVGSGQVYHPHMFMFLTNLDTAFAGLADNFLTAYVENNYQNNGTLVFAIQDGANVDEGNIGNNLVGVTENRSVAGCNGDSDGYGDGACYLPGAPGNHTNGKQWNSSTGYFNSTAGTAFYKGDWHRIECYFKLNTISGGIGQQDGIIRYWYDGTLVFEHTDIVMRTGQHPTMKFNQIAFAPFIGDGSTVNQTMYIDRLVLATSRITLPTVNTVTGTISNGNAITVSGTNLHNETRTGWETSFVTNKGKGSFEGTAPYGGGSDGYTQPGGDPGTGCTVDYTTAVNLIGNQALRMISVETNGSGSSGSGFASIQVGLNSALQAIAYVRVYARYHRNTIYPTSYAKQIYMFDCDYYIDVDGATFPSQPTSYNGKWGAASFNIPLPSETGYSEVEDDRWYCIEAFFTCPPNSRHMTVWIDGVQVYDDVPSSSKNDDLSTCLLGVINAQGTAGSAWNFTNYMDGFAAGTQRIFPACLVEIGNNSDYGIASKVRQPLTKISDVDVRFTCNVTGLGAGPYWLFVTNNAQQRVTFAL